jgi:hypothetical protein
MLLIFPLLALVACQSHNPLGPLQSGAPQLSFNEEIFDLNNGEFTYQQGINVDCVLSASLQFAFQPICLPGKVLPGYQTNKDGWILFGKDLIWSSKNEISFHFDSVEGSLKNLVTEVSVKVKHPDGRIEELNSPFKSSRLLGSHLENTFAPGAELSAGIEFQLRENTGNIFIEGMYADHFMYRLNILDENLQPITSGEWFNSLNCPDIRNIHLSLNSEPALSYNAPVTFTQFEYYLVSRLGMIQADPGSIHFRVLDGFKPVAKIYPQTLVGYGMYHYGFDPDLMLDNVQLIPGTSERYNSNLGEINGMKTAINSADFKLHLHWGHYGLYYDKNYNVPTDNPLYGVQTNAVLNPAGTNYDSAIVAYWLQLDNNEFPLKPYQLMGHQVVTDELGQVWTRILNLNHGFRHTVLSGLSNGIHSFRVMAEDLQGVKSDPAEMTFQLIAYTPPSQRNGILIVDNDPHSVQASPEAFVDAFYQNISSSFGGTVDQIDFGTTGSLSAAQLMNYSAVLIHADNPGSTPALFRMYEGFDLYLEHQGNLIISATNKLRSALQDVATSPGGQSFLQNRLGLSTLENLGTISNSIAIDPYFVSALGIQSFPDIPLNTTSPFSSIVNIRQGISSVTYFEENPAMDYIYALGCKAVGADEYSPTLEQYDYYSSKYVALRHAAQGSKVYLFGFPLSYMEQDAAVSSMQQIASEISGTTYAKGRNQ